MHGHVLPAARKGDFIILLGNEFASLHEEELATLDFYREDFVLLGSF